MIYTFFIARLHGVIKNDSRNYHFGLVVFKVLKVSDLAYELGRSIHIRLESICSHEFVYSFLVMFVIQGEIVQYGDKI